MKLANTHILALAVALTLSGSAIAQPAGGSAEGTTAATRAPAGPTTQPCTGLTGTDRASCERTENASNALCFGSSGKVRADCENSYNPGRMRARSDGKSGAAGADLGRGDAEALGRSSNPATDDDRAIPRAGSAGTTGAGMTAPGASTGTSGSNGK